MNRPDYAQPYNIKSVEGVPIEDIPVQLRDKAVESEHRRQKFESVNSQRYADNKRKMRRG